MDVKALVVKEIVSLNDDLLLPWLDLYETAFPAEEKVLVSCLLGFLKGKGRRRHHLLAGVGPGGTLMGLAMYEEACRARAALLWYLAVVPSERNKGIGEALYRDVMSRVDLRQSDAMVLEVEMPEMARTEAQRALATRRIEFYRRLGARVLTGIRYVQRVGDHVQETPMHIMVHPFLPMSSEEALSLAQGLFPGQVTQTGGLDLG